MRACSNGLRRNRAPRCFTTTVTRGEILYGVRLLPAGRRRRNPEEAVLAVFRHGFANRVLGFDVDAADLDAEISASRKVSARPISQVDAVIAAVARSRSAALATRNARDFVGCGIELIDPWLP